MKKGKWFELLLTVVILALCLILIVPRIFGIQMIHVVSGSMEPAIPTGSLVVVVPVDPLDLQEGEVITFEGGLSGNMMTTHRIIENQTAKNQIITKGDANKQNDRNPVKYSKIVGKVVISVPFFGNVLSLLATPIVKIVLIVGVVILFIIRKR